MANVKDAFQGLANINLWFKNNSGDELLLSDIPEIIPLRWTYFRDNWEFIKVSVSNKASSYLNPDFLNQQVNDFTKFIDTQRTSNKNINPFSDGTIFTKFYTIFDNIPIQSINVTNDEETFISNKLAKIAQYSKNDFLNIKNNIINYRNYYTDTVGLGDADYDTTIHRSAVNAQLDATIVDLNYLQTLQNGLKSIDFILANLFAVDAFIDHFALARANANNPDINIGSYASGRLIRMNYGEDLESLAARYLGDPNKWIDIAIANGLQPPYIDEVGTALPLLANGNGNEINIAATDINGNININRFYINQAVFLQSTTEMFPNQRVVLNIRQIPVSGEIILTLDGEGNLSNYQIADNASVRVYTPGTINSSFYVLIPSTDPLPDARRDEVPWFLIKSPEDEKRTKIDIAIDENGELNFDTSGDIKLSYGLANAVQAIKLKLITELGSLRYHPNFGLINTIGNKNNNIDDIKAQITDSINNQIQIDPRFDRVESLNVDYLSSNATNNGVTAFVITMTVRLAGGSTVVPISFNVYF